MQPRIASVLRARYWTTSIVRIAALLLAAWGILQLVGAIFQVMAYLGYFTFDHVLVLLWPLRWVALAIAIAILEQRLVRWLFPLPRQGCPRCGYPISGRPEGACPECGLVMA